MKKLFIVFIICLFPISLYSKNICDFETSDGKVLEGVGFSSENDIAKNLIEGLQAITNLSEADCICLKNFEKRCVYKDCTKTLDEAIKKQMEKQYMTHAVYFEPLSEKEWEFSFIRYKNDSKKYYIKKFKVNINTNYFLISRINGGKP